MSDDLAPSQLRSLVERIERIEEEIRDLNGDKSDIYKEAKGAGFDVPTIRKIVAARKLDPSERDERDALFDLYWTAIESAPSRVRVHEAKKSPSPAPRGATGDTGGAGANVVPPDTVSDQPQEGGSDAKSAVDPSVEEYLIPGRRLNGSQEAGRQPPVETLSDTAPTESVADTISAPLSHSDAAPHASEQTGEAPVPPQIAASPVASHSHSEAV